MLSVHQYSNQRVCRVPSTRMSKGDEPNCTDPGYKRMEYFRNYLRPPKEEILEGFRQCALKEKILCAFHCHTWNFAVVLLLLLALLIPVNKQMRYHQQSSIHKWLFSSLNTRSLTTKFAVTNWLPTDFINNIYSENDELNNLGFATGCISVSDITIRYFSATQIDDIPPYSNNNKTNHTIYTLASGGERLIVHGYHRTYYEINAIILHDNKTNAINQINTFSYFLADLTSGVVSIEFLLFNPSLSFLNLINVQFEFTEKNAITTKSITTVKLMDMNCFVYVVKFFIHLIFLLVVLMECKNQTWELFKNCNVYLRNCWNYYSFVFNVVSISYLWYYFSFILQLKLISHRFKESDLKSHTAITDSIIYENVSHNLLAFLIFMHLIKSFRLLVFSHRLKMLGARLLKSWKILSVTLFIVTFFLNLCDFMRRIFSGLQKQSHQPLFVCLDAIGSLFRDNQKPEITKETVAFEKCISIIITFIFIALYTYFFAFVRAVLIGNKSTKQSVKTKHISIKNSGKVLNKKLKEFFRPEKPQIILKENYILPIEFLLLELEELGEKLLKKADELFSKEDTPLADNSSEEFPTSFEVTNDLKLKSDIEFAVSKVMQNSNFKPLTNSEVDVVKSLNATVPRLSKLSGKKFVPTSLNASLASQRKFKYQDVNLSASLQCHKIRKTYPLQLNSDSSSETFSTAEKERLPNFTLRKTKSKGKGKSCDLDLNISDFKEPALK